MGASIFLDSAKISAEMSSVAMIISAASRGTTAGSIQGAPPSNVRPTTTASGKPKLVLDRRAVMRVLDTIREQLRSGEPRW